MIYLAQDLSVHHQKVRELLEIIIIIIIIIIIVIIPSMGGGLGYFLGSSTKSSTEHYEWVVVFI